ncbi:7140_t:CDS:1, partial [Racocetra fulgida]
ARNECRKCGAKLDYIDLCCRACEAREQDAASRCPGCGKSGTNGEKCIDCIARENQIQCVKCKGYFLDNGQAGGGDKGSFVCNQCNWKQPNGEERKCDKCKTRPVVVYLGSLGKFCQECKGCDECGHADFRECLIKYKGKKICVNCHHKLLGEERRDKTQEHNKYTCERCHASC